jgi:hypothetical protein
MSDACQDGSGPRIERASRRRLSDGFLQAALRVTCELLTGLGRRSRNPNSTVVV